jgi:hypothetical protein
MKPILRIIPLIYFIGLSLFWITENYMSTGTINYIAIAVAVVLMAQLFIKNKIAGLATGLVMGLFSCYMLLALLSDLAKVKEFTSGTYKFMAFGGGLFGVGVLMSVLLVVYFAKMNANKARAISVK